MSRAKIHGNTLIYKGSTCLRERLVLSLLSGKAVKITQIRVNQENTGLQEYEVSLVGLLYKLSNGTKIEINDSATSIFFQPGLLQGGQIYHECCPQRGIAYYLEAIFMVAIFCKQPIVATLRGVTSNKIDPSMDTMKTSMLSILKKLIIDDDGVDVEIKKRGMPPLGGGEVIFTCPVQRKLRPMQLEDPGKVKRVRGTAYALRVSPALANRMIDKAKGVVLNFIPDVFITADQCKGKRGGNSPGFGIQLYAETTKGTVYTAQRVSNVADEDPVTPEDLGEAVAQDLLMEIYHGGAVESVCQGLAIVLMVLAQDVSKLVTSTLTDYSIELLRHIKEFFGIMFHVEPFEQGEETSLVEGVLPSEKVCLTCIGIGYTNVSK